MFHLRHSLFCFLAFQRDRRQPHESRPFIDRTFTSGTLVGENASNRMRMKIKTNTIPS